MVSKQTMTNISDNNGELHLKLGNSDALYELHHKLHILMLLWQHSLFQFSFCFESNITICDPIW